MDLTKEYPRSVRETFAGIAQLGRTTDKAKAVAHGDVGEYHYNCGMDQAVFEFLGIDHEKYLDFVRNAKNDTEIEQYARQFTGKKSPQELDEWSRTWLSKQPTGESLEFFEQLRSKIAPDRTDVTNWPDLLDLDEKRVVPRREPARA